MTNDWLTMMARYTAWQHAWMLPACDALDDVEADRGLFFGSVANTLRHVLWADAVWMSRFDGTPPPREKFSQSTRCGGDWESYKAARAEMDAYIADWAARAPCEGDLTWFSGLEKREITRPRAMLYTHFFNHATQHRGQVHAALTQAGIKTGDTDLFLMPQESET